MTITTVRDNYFMFVRWVENAETRRAVCGGRGGTGAGRTPVQSHRLFRQLRARVRETFIARTQPDPEHPPRRSCTAIRISSQEVLEGRHFDDDVMAYGFHDQRPRLQIQERRPYGRSVQPCVSPGSIISWPPGC